MLWQKLRFFYAKHKIFILVLVLCGLLICPAAAFRAERAFAPPSPESGLFLHLN
jgi:hypothetical protein